MVSSLPISNSHSYRLGSALFIGALAVYPYLFLLNILYPSTLPFGKNTYIFLVTGIIVLCFLLQGKEILSKVGFGTVCFIIFLAFFIVIIREWLYAEGAKYSFAHRIGAYRIILTPIIYCGVAYWYLKEKEKRHIAAKIIFWNCLIQVIFGIAHYYFFSSLASIGLPVRDIWVEGQREHGILTGINLYAHTIPLGIFLLTDPYRKWKLSEIVKCALILVLIWGISLSASRWPLIIALVLLALYLKKFLFSGKIIFIPIIIFLYLLSRPTSIVYTIERLVTYGLTHRFIKYSLALKSLFENLSNFLWGPPFKYSGLSLIGVERISFTDNSYLLLMITFGVPFIVIFLFLSAHIIRKTVSLNRNYLLLFYFLGTLFLTNSILWDMWLFYLFATLYAMQPDFKLNRSFKKDVLI